MKLSALHMIPQCVALLAIIMVTPAFGSDYGFDVDRIYYQDNSARTINYDFTGGQMQTYGRIEIPASAVVVPAPEDDSSFYLEPIYEKRALNLDTVAGSLQISIPQALTTVKPIPAAAISIDGNDSDWSGIAAYIDDSNGEVPSWQSTDPGDDLDDLKLAYSPDKSKLFILMKLNGTANQSTLYRLFLDKNLNDETEEPGDYQIEMQYTGTGWDVVSQSWNSQMDDWDEVIENGVAEASGVYLEAAVDAAVFGLPAKVNVYGRTINAGSPSYHYDAFSIAFPDSAGIYYLVGDCEEPTVPNPDVWEISARLTNFRNVSQIQHFYSISLSTQNPGSTELEPEITAAWFSGVFGGKRYQNALILELEVENDVDGPGGYEWEWEIENGGGLVLPGLDPVNTTLDLKIEVTNAGQTLSGYYRLNSDDPQAWQMLVTHTLPPGTGTIYGYCHTRPIIALVTGTVDTPKAMPWMLLLNN